jgi:hypothetical protein
MQKIATDDSPIALVAMAHFGILRFQQIVPIFRTLEAKITVSDLSSHRFNPPPEWRSQGYQARRP